MCSNQGVRQGTPNAGKSLSSTMGHIPAYIYTYVYTHVCVYIYIYIYIYIYLCVCVHIHKAVSRYKTSKQKSKLQEEIRIPRTLNKLRSHYSKVQVQRQRCK